MIKDKKCYINRVLHINNINNNNNNANIYL